MKRLILIPDGWLLTLSECPPGHFISGEELCFKSEYLTEKGSLEVFCSSGEAFWGSKSDSKERDKMKVQPVFAKWIDEE